MTAADSYLLKALKDELSTGYWASFNAEARDQMAHAALEAINRKEQELIRLGVRH